MTKIQEFADRVRKECRDRCLPYKEANYLSYADIDFILNQVQEEFK